MAAVLAISDPENTDIQVEHNFNIFSIFLYNSVQNSMALISRIIQCKTLVFLPFSVVIQCITNIFTAFHYNSAGKVYIVVTIL